AAQAQGRLRTRRAADGPAQAARRGGPVGGVEGPHRADDTGGARRDDRARRALMSVPYRTVATELQFPEGPTPLADGSVLVVEIPRGTLSRVGPDGTVSVVAECGGGPNGSAIGPDGAVWITNNGGCFEWIDVGGILVPGGVPDE